LKACNESVAAAVEWLYNEKHKNQVVVIHNLGTMGVVTDCDRLNYLLSKVKKNKELDRLNNDAPMMGLVEVSGRASCSTMSGTLTDDF
jgi:hypothetical protein